MSLIRQLAGQTVVYGLGHILSKVLYFIVLTTYLTNRFPNTKDYGIYAEMYAYAAILIVILSYRIDTAFFKFGSIKGQLQKAFTTAFVPLVLSTVIMVLLGISFAAPIAELIGYPDRPHYVKWFVVILGFDVLVLLPYARMRLEKKPLQFVSYRLFNILLTIALVLAFLEFPAVKVFIQPWLPEIKTEIEFVFLSNLIASAAVFLLMLFSLNLRSWKVDWLLWKRMVLFALPLIVVGIAGSFNQFFAIPLQKFLLGNSFDENLTQAGIYAAPQRIAALLALFTTAFNYAAEPFFFSNADRKDAKTMYGKICLLFAMIGGLVVLGLFFYLDFFQFLIGKNYREGLVIVPILLMAYLMLGIYYNISIWYKLADKTVYGAFISIVGACITFFISLYFLPRIGYIASAWAALLSFTTMNVICYFLGQRNYPIDYPVRKIILVLLVLISSIAIGQYTDLKLGSWIALVFKTILLLSYLYFIYKLDTKSFKDLFNRSK